MTTRPKLELHPRLVLAATMAESDPRGLALIQQERDLLSQENEVEIREAFAYFAEVQDPESRNRLFCFLWALSGLPWKVPPVAIPKKDS